MTESSLNFEESKQTVVENKKRGSTRNKSELDDLRSYLGLMDWAIGNPQSTH